jgi:hypothetical protein
MDVESYMEYMLTQIYLGNYDWPHNNVKIWKKKEGGKWRWILYDTDFGFNLYDTSLHSFNSLTFALGENTGKPTQEWATRLFKRLVLNDTFRNDFIDRFSIHLSSTFETKRVNYVIDSIAAKIRTEMAYHKGKWGSYRTFEADISAMKTFSSARATNMLGFLRNRFLSGASVQTIDISSNIPHATFTFNNQPIIDNSILLNTFSGKAFTLKANTTKGYVFKHWESNSTTNSTTPIPWDSHWKYWDSGSMPATNWHTTGYSDASWKTGQAQLGYGLPGMKTTIGFGPDANNKYPTAYFRKTFTIDDLSAVNSASVRVFADDGAAVYINGTEIGRFNLPSGALSFTTFTTTWNNGEYADFTIPISLLTNGSNLVAVEVHQTSASSSDMLFNLELSLHSVSAGSNASTNQTLTGVVGSNMRFRAIFEEDALPDPVADASVSINEIVASNSIIRDEHGDKDDYFELYNNGAEPVNISGWYVSDKKGVPMLWQLPNDASAIIPAKGFLVLWADEQTHQGALHVDFKLSATGEFISLYAQNKYGQLILKDSVTFPSLLANQSYSRVPDGGSQWLIQSPTPFASNLSTGIESDRLPRVQVYPTRFTDKVFVENAAGMYIQVVDMTGKRIVYQKTESQVCQLLLNHLSPGIYILKVNEQNFILIK